MSSGRPVDESEIGAWRARVLRVGARLGWPDRRCVVRRHAGGILLAISAPADQLLLATEVNEWALCAVLAERDPKRWGGLEDALIAAAIEENAPDGAPSLLPVIEESAALSRFAQLSSIEAAPKMRALIRPRASGRCRTLPTTSN